MKPGELVSLYLTNQPEFLFAHLGSWAVGSAPAFINHHLAGDALVHCLKVAGGSLLLVDEDSDARDRVEAVRDRIEGELGMTIRILDKQLKGEILRMEPQRPEDEYRAGVTGTFPIFLFYTRSVPWQLGHEDALLTCLVALLGTPKRVPSRPSALAFWQSDAREIWASVMDRMVIGGTFPCRCIMGPAARLRWPACFPV